MMKLEEFTKPKDPYEELTTEALLLELIDISNDIDQAGIAFDDRKGLKSGRAITENN